MIEMIFFIASATCLLIYTFNSKDDKISNYINPNIFKLKPEEKTFLVFELSEHYYGVKDRESSIKETIRECDEVGTKSRQSERGGGPGTGSDSGTSGVGTGR